MVIGRPVERHVLEEGYGYIFISLFGGCSVTGRLKGGVFFKPTANISLNICSQVRFLGIMERSCVASYYYPEALERVDIVV